MIAMVVIMTIVITVVVIVTIVIITMVVIVTIVIAMVVIVTIVIIAMVVIMIIVIAMVVIVVIAMVIVVIIVITMVMVVIMIMTSNQPGEERAVLDTDVDVASMSLMPVIITLAQNRISQSDHCHDGKTRKHGGEPPLRSSTTLFFKQSHE